MYELPHELPNDLRPGKFSKMSKLHVIINLVPSLPPKKKILSILGKDSLKIETELFP